MKRILLLGASGSIGTQTLDILKAHPNEFELVGFSVGKQVDKVEPILSAFPAVKAVCIQDKEAALAFADEHDDYVVYCEDSGLNELIEEVDCDMVVNALVGFVGLKPTIRALELGKKVATANKESLVVGGKLVNALLDEGKGELFPIDSEHVAISKLLSRVSDKEIAKIRITASGGALRKLPAEELASATPEMALAHPNWKMGDKITIDCATMMNKGFELIEACVLFRRPMEDFNILMHEESYVHSAIQTKNGRYLLDISKPDMHGPIEYALFEGKAEFELTEVRSLQKLKEFHFGEFDPDRYPAVALCQYAYEKGGNAPAILNAANEVAVYAFLNHEIGFTEIVEYVEEALDEIPYLEDAKLEDLVFSDAMTRAYVKESIRLHGKPMLGDE